MRARSKNRRKPVVLDRKSDASFLHRAYSRMKWTKSQLFKHPLSVLLLYIIALYAVMIPVFYGCRPDRFLFGR